jgi:hypothetical protein
VKHGHEHGIARATRDARKEKSEEAARARYAEQFRS